MNIFQQQKIVRGQITRGALKIFVNTAKEFSEVYHITHLSAAKHLLESHKIHPQLIQDQSALNGEMIKVVWLSPNEWINGSLYGNIRFSYNFNDLINNKKFYAVEVMNDYNPPACRILISDKEYQNHPVLKPYNPYIEFDGPWHIDAEGRNFYYEHCNIEFMFESDLDLSSAFKIDFVSHHSRFCNIHANTSCPDRNMSYTAAKLFFISHLVANDLRIANLAINKETAEWSVVQIVGILTSIRSILYQNSLFEKQNVLADKTKRELCKSILEQISKKNNEAAKELSKIFKSREDLDDTLEKLFAEYFDLEQKDLKI